MIVSWLWFIVNSIVLANIINIIPLGDLLTKKNDVTASRGKIQFTTQFYVTFLS